MTDPISMVALGAAIGGAAGKFVEKAWDSGEKWLSSYFNNHQPKAQEQAKENTANFLSELANRVKTLESTQAISKEKIEQAQDHPDFSSILHKAMISSAQTENKDKHKLLARLVSDRMKVEPEDMLALASKMACDAISYTNNNQLKILGLSTTLGLISPTTQMPKAIYYNWLGVRTAPFLDVSPTDLDYLHLEALSCLKYETFITRDLNKILKSRNNDFDYEEFTNAGIGKILLNLWVDKNLQSISLTSVGQIIGVYVSDLLTNSQTSFTDWK